MQSKCSCDVGINDLSFFGFMAGMTIHRPGAELHAGTSLLHRLLRGTMQTDLSGLLPNKITLVFQSKRKLVCIPLQSPLARKSLVRIVLHLIHMVHVGWSSSDLYIRNMHHSGSRGDALYFTNKRVGVFESNIRVMVIGFSTQPEG